ncbi:MAG: hypothetical protein PVF17_08310 [Ignavibacteria bacterium]|jgi:hypothetical protein
MGKEEITLEFSSEKINAILIKLLVQNLATNHNKNRAPECNGRRFY